MTTTIRKHGLAAIVFAGALLCLAGQAGAIDYLTELPADRIPTIETGGDCLIRGGTILTASHGRIEKGDILVRGGKITAIGTDLEAPEGVTVIDAAGRTVIPGIIDCHSHMAISGGVNEGSLAITAECRIHDTIRNDDLTIYRALAGGVTAANLLHGSANPIGGQNAVIKLKYLHPVEEMRFPGAPPGIKFALGENPKRSRSSGPSTRFPATRMGVEAVIRRGFIEAQQYIAQWDRYSKNRLRGLGAIEPRRDLRLETLAGILRGEILVHSHCYRADEILMLIRVADEFGFGIATFQHVLEGYKVAPEIAAHGAGGSAFSDWWAYKVEAYEAIPYNCDIMAKAGVVVSVNSDSGEMVRRLYHEAAKGLKYGDFTDEEALRLVTLNPAIQLGIDHKVGSIDVGKDADIAIFNGDPLSIYSRCEMTLVDGEVLFQRVERPIEIHPFDIEDATTRTTERKPTMQPVSTEAGATVAIVGATLHPVSSAAIEGGTLVIRGSRIADVGKDVAVPDDARVIDGSGLHVYPGMINSGTSIGLSEIGSVSATQDTRENGSYNPDLRSWIAINHDSEVIPVTRVNGITSVMTTPTGGVISGQAALIQLDGWTREELLLEAPVAMAMTFPRLGNEQKWQDNAAVKELIDWLERARTYHERTREAAQRGLTAPKRDPKLEALAPFARGEKRVTFGADSIKAMVDIIEFCEAQGLDPVLIGCKDAWKIADYLAKKDVPCIVGPVLTTPSASTDPYDSAFFNASVLQRAGVRFAFRSGDTSNARNLPYHAGMAAAFGLDKEAAYRAVSLSAAEIWGVDDRIGSLERGKLADVLVTDGDPFEFRTQTQHLFIRGREIPLETKHTRLYERYLERVSGKEVKGMVREF